MASATLSEEEVWSLLGRVREALGEFLPEAAIGDSAPDLDTEAEELVKGIRIFGNLPPRSDLRALNRKFAGG